MNRRTLVALSMALVLTVTACHKTPATDPGIKPIAGNPPPPPPPPPPPSNPGNNNTTRTTPPPDDGAFLARVTKMQEKIHFDYNEAAIRTDDNARLDAKAALLKQFSTLRIRITGHADERGSDQYNIALGKRRADAAKDYLVRVGIDASRIETSSLGREVPENSGHDESAWAQNRRDEFEIIAGTPSLRVP